MLTRYLDKSNKERCSGFTPHQIGAGFTFIEMIIVSAVVCVVALAIYATVNNGLRIWQRVNQQLPYEDVNIFLEKFSLDLKNCFKFSSIDFLGTERSLSFATLVSSPKLKARTVGKVIYFYDANNETLTRELNDFSDVYSGGVDSLKQAINNIKSSKFQYYYYDRQAKKYAWLDEWVSTKTQPLAVRIELELDDVSQGIKFYRTVGIPVADF
jgi:prepilin-type N-terminal cleavage/methylation domain-containing protein